MAETHVGVTGTRYPVTIAQAAARHRTIIYIWSDGLVTSEPENALEGARDDRH